MFRCGNEGGERNGRERICKRWAKIPVKTFPINTELFIDRKWGLYIRISKIGSRKYQTSQKRVKYLREITVAGVKTVAACVLANLQLLGRETIQWQLVWNDFELQKWKIASRKKEGKWACTTIIAFIFDNLNPRSYLKSNKLMV